MRENCCVFGLLTRDLVVLTLPRLAVISNCDMEFFCISNSLKFLVFFKSRFHTMNEICRKDQKQNQSSFKSMEQHALENVNFV
jgi:hypothetical protein